MGNQRQMYKPVCDKYMEIQQLKCNTVYMFYEYVKIIKSMFYKRN